MPKPNPSLSGTSRFPHAPIWLMYERQILEWWLANRDALIDGTKTAALAPNPNDAQLLSAEKEVLEWWFQNRKELLA